MAVPRPGLGEAVGRALAELHRTLHRPLAGRWVALCLGAVAHSTDLQTALSSVVVGGVNGDGVHQP